ncbi:MAG: hypothetical protein IJ621_05995 [Paludibacteraceae bacterium]|nr:hypothetical protein [Paludibacteraceae bacterium]
MNKHSVFLLWLLLLIGARTGAEAALVEVTMNSVTRTLTLKNSAGDVIAEDAMTTAASKNTYVFNNLPAGEYILEGYNSSNELNGTMTFSVGDADISMQIWTITKIAVTNSGWVYGTDYTIENVEVHSREGVTYPVTLGENAGNSSVLTYDGGSVVLRFVPSDARVAEGYVASDDGRTVTGNTTIQGKIREGGLFTSTCPVDAEIAMMQKPGGDGGSGTIHFTPFRVIAPESVETSGSTKTYTWRLGTGGKYNMRAWKTGGLTQLLTFYYNTDESKCPVINFTEADFSAKNPKWVDDDPKSLDGLNDCNIFININEKNYLKMVSGQEYNLMAERDWQIIPNQTENYFLEPDYHYAVYDMNGNPDNSVVEVVPDGNIGSEWSILRAKKAGTAIVTVTYDAASAVQYANNGKMSPYYGGQYFGAIWPENTGVFVVSVDAPENGMDANMRINETYNEDQKKNAGIYVDAEHDVFYYINDEETFNYTFKPTGVQTVEISYPTIRTNDAVYNTGWHAVSKNADNTYTLPLKHGRQIVRMGDGTGKYEYQVLTARHATRTITNETTSKDKFFPGDNVKIQYDGLFHPANKLSGIYNMSAYVTYNGVPAGTALILGRNQYWFGSTPSAQAISFTIPTDYTDPTMNLTDGVIQVTGFGDPIGNHRTIDKVGGRSPNFTAVAHQTYFGALPETIIPVTQPTKSLVTFVLTPEETVISKVTNSLGVELTPDAEGRYLLTEGDNTVHAEATGYKRSVITVTIEEGDEAEKTVTIALEAIPEEGWNGTDNAAVTPVDGIYHIQTGAQLAWFAAQVNAGTGKSWKAVLDNDIDLCGYDWMPIGISSAKPYSGIFDGQGFAIKNLFINTPDGRYYGLFGYLTNATVKNMTVYGSVTSGYDKTTGVQLGGVIGHAQGAKATPCTISGITNYANVTGHSKYVAGIVGYAQSYVNIDRCANYGNVTVSNATKTYGTDVAGIAFMNGTYGTITNSYNCGDIVANNNVGGIYASTVNITVTNVYNTGRVHATQSNNSGYSCHGAIRPMANTTGTTDKVTNAYADEDFLFNELNTTIITAPEAWTGGEVAYKLGDAFGQEIGVDPLPVIGGKKVYQHEIGGKTYYSNYQQKYVREGLEDGKYGTLCFPYTAGETKGGEFYSIEKKYMDGGLFKGIGLVEETTVAAGKPYIFKATDEQIILFYNETDEATAGQFNGLIGTFDYVTIPVGDWYIKDNGLKLAGEGNHASANRAYIHAESITDASAGFAPSARRMIIGLERPMPTAVDEDETEQSIEKYIKNGRLYIRKDGQVYDAQGKRID